MTNEKAREHRCVDCGVTIEGHGNRKRCKACGDISDRRRRAAWAEKNRERSAAKQREMRQRRSGAAPAPVCGICGREYVRRSGFQRYCSDCRAKLHEERRPRPAKGKRKRLTLSQVERIAREHGMSYGYAVAAGLDIAAR